MDLHSLSPQLAVGTSMVTGRFPQGPIFHPYLHEAISEIDYKSGAYFYLSWSGPGGISDHGNIKFLNQDTFSYNTFGIPYIRLNFYLCFRNTNLKPLSSSQLRLVIKRSFTDNWWKYCLHYQFHRFLLFLYRFIVLRFISGIILELVAVPYLFQQWCFFLHSSKHIAVATFNASSISISNL